MLFTAGTLNNYIKTLSLQQKATRRINNVNLKKGDSDFPVNPTKHLVEGIIQQTQESRQRQLINIKVESITGKLKCGSPVSGEDLEFLKQNAPALYTKALEVAQERKSYEERLNQCRTKEEVERVKSSRIQGFLTQIQTVQRSNMDQGKKLEAIELIGWKLLAVNDEHVKFVRTKEYAKLPTEEEERKKKDEEKKKKTDGDQPEDSIEELIQKLNSAMQRALDELKMNQNKEKDPDDIADSETVPETDMDTTVNVTVSIPSGTSHKPAADTPTLPSPSSKGNADPSTEPKATTGTAPVAPAPATVKFSSPSAQKLSPGLRA